MTLSAVLRCAASPSTGGGHVIRCLAIAELAAHMGWECSFLSPPESAAVVPQMRSFRRIDAPPSHADIVVVDDYQTGLLWESSSRAWAGRVVVIDDFAVRKHDCDLLVDSSPIRNPFDYGPWVPAGTRVMTGPAFAPLRDQYRRARPGALHRRQSAGIRNVLINFGASDPLGRAVLAAQATLSALPDATVTVVAGAGSPHRRALDDIAAEAPARFRILDAVADMAALMAEADVAIGAAGHSSWERCALGLPTIVLPTADNQRDNLKALVSAGAAEHVDDAHVSVDGIARKLKVLAGDPERLTALSRNAAQLCDGRGAIRIVVAALSARQSARNGKFVALRPAEAADAKQLFAWQTDEQTRRFFRNPRAPTWSEHELWLGQVLEDPSQFLFLVECGGLPAGSVRLVEIPRGLSEVSIYVAPGMYRGGIGKAALNLLRRLFPRKIFSADVLAGNDASAALFLGSGYCRESSGMYVQHPPQG